MNTPGGVDDSPEANSNSAQAGWTVLFDGNSTSAWRGFKQQELPSGWQIVDAALTRVGGGGDIITRDQFGDFELELEWKLAPKGNSGIMFRVTEGDSNTYRTGPEMQVLDDGGHRDGQNRLTSAGSNYALHPAPAGVVKPVGEWNQVRLIVRGAHVEHWLNGQKVVEYELWSPDWEAKVKASKFVAWPRYGRERRGHIALQDHGDWVAYRNIRIRAL
ncbi:MAG: 3-keto-disaccharide hydrolase [Gemmatimonadaceae bacterium]